MVMTGRIRAATQICSIRAFFWSMVMQESSGLTGTSRFRAGVQECPDGHLQWIGTQRYTQGFKLSLP